MYPSAFSMTADPPQFDIDNLARADFVRLPREFYAVYRFIHTNWSLYLFLQGRVINQVIIRSGCSIIIRLNLSSSLSIWVSASVYAELASSIIGVSGNRFRAV